MPRKPESVRDVPNPLNPREQQELVLRVANSRAFVSSHTLRAFLLYVAENAIAGKLDAIKEQYIGFHVLGRKPDYDPAEDNIVRVRARQLRQRLDEYFASEGQREPVVISIPKGGYVPIFMERLPSPEIEPVAEVTVLPPPEAARRQRPLSFHVPGALAWLIAAAAVFAACVLWVRRDRKTPPVPDQATVDVPRGLWSQIFPTKGQELTVVTADAGFALWQDVTHHTLNLGDYLSRRYLEEGEGPEMREVAARRTTSPADLSVSLRLAEIARVFGGHVKVHFARSMDIHDFKNGNLVLVGSRRSNPWVELFENQMNFILDYNPNLKGPCFLNRSPKLGESKSYSLRSPYTVQGAESRAIESYAVIALLPVSSGHGRVIVLEGLSMEGTEAAGEFVTNSERFGMLLRKIGLKNDAPLKPFEVLLKLTAVAGGYADPQLIAYRYPSFAQ